jgi:AcrR family transcriptional regulator
MPRISKAREREVRGRILEAGLRVFDEQGFRRASMQAIAAAAGLSIGGLYTYFTSKEELFVAAFDALWAEEERQFEAAIATAPSTADRIALAIGYWLDRVVLRDQPGFRGSGAGFLLHGWANAAEMPGLRAILVRRRDHIETLGRVVVREGIARGELPAWTDVEGLTAGLTSAFDALVFLRAERGPAFDHDLAERQLTAVARAILASAALAEPPELDVPRPGPGAAVAPGTRRVRR